MMGNRTIIFFSLWTLASGTAQACSVSATNLQFGTIDPLVATDHDSTSTITVTCSGILSTAYTVSLSTGSGTYSQRQMSSGANILDYNLYTDSARTDIWGDGTGSTSAVSGSANETGTDHTVYGRSPHQPAALPGSYSDSITVTVTY